LWDVCCKGHEERPKNKETLYIQSSHLREREEAITATQERTMKIMNSIGVQKTNECWFSQQTKDLGKNMSGNHL